MEPPGCTPLYGQGRSMERGQRGRPNGEPPVFCPQKSKHARIKVENQNSRVKKIQDYWKNDVSAARWNIFWF